MNTGLPRYCNKDIPVPRVLCHSLTEVTKVQGRVWNLIEITEVPGTGTKVLQNSQNFRLLWHGRTELTEVPGEYKNAVTLYPYPGYLWNGRTELTKVPGTGMNVVQNLQKFRVRVCMPYRTYLSSLSVDTWGKYPGYGSVRTLQNTLGNWAV